MTTFRFKKAAGYKHGYSVWPPRPGIVAPGARLGVVYRGDDAHDGWANDRVPRQRYNSRQLAAEALLLSYGVGR